MAGTTFVAAFIFVPSRNDIKSRRDFSQVLSRLDLPGVFTSIPGLILLTFALTSGNENNNRGWSSAAVIVTLVISVLLLLFFVYIEAKVSMDPLLPKQMWQRGNPLLPSAALAAATYAVWQGLNYFLTLELQGQLHDAVQYMKSLNMYILFCQNSDFGFSALSTSIRFLPLGVSAFLINMIVPRLLVPLGPRILFVAGWLITIPGVVLLSLLRDGGDYWRFAFPGMILYILGVCTVYLVANIVVVGSAAPEDQGTVAGVYNVCLGPSI